MVGQGSERRVLALTALGEICGGTLTQGGVQAPGSALARAEQALAGQFRIRPVGLGDRRTSSTVQMARP